MSVIQPRTKDMVDMSPIEPGTYPAAVTSAEAQTSKAGNSMVVVSIAVQVDEGKDPRPRTAYLAIEGKGTWGFDQFLRAIHMDEIADKLKEGEDVPIDTDAFIGQELNVVMSEQLYEGQVRDQIQTYLKR